MSNHSKFIPTCLNLPKIIGATLAVSMCLAGGYASAGHKGNDGDFTVTVLGSGGPAATAAGRASAGYLISTNGEPRILMDAGGGTFQRLAKTGVNIKDLEVILLSHLHIDHTADLSSMIKTVYFHNVGAGVTRDVPFEIYGPADNNATFPGTVIKQYPSSTEFLDGHYAMPNGVERYMNIFTALIQAGTFGYKPHDLPSDVANGSVEEVVTMGKGKNKLVVSSIAVTHGPVPSVAYRIDFQGHSIVYSGDTNSSSDNMIKLAKNADVLIYDTAIMDTHPNPVMLKLHTTPSRMGQVAAAANVDKLVLSHITPNTEGKFDDIKDLIKQQGFTGEIEVAKDLEVYEVE